MDKRVLELMWNHLAERTLVSAALISGTRWEKLTDQVRQSFLMAFDLAYENIHGDEHG